MRFCPATAEENANISKTPQAIQAEVAHNSSSSSSNSYNNEIGMHQLAVVVASPWETRPSQELKRTKKRSQTRLKDTVPTTKVGLQFTHLYIIISMNHVSCMNIIIIISS